MSKNIITTRICALCDKKIRNDHVVCREHLAYYLAHKDEEWMQELIKTNRRQFEVDNEEIAYMHGDTLPERTTPKITRRRLTETDKKRILYYRQKGLGYTTISKILGLNPRTIQSYIDIHKL